MNKDSESEYNVYYKITFRLTTLTSTKCEAG